MSLLDKLHLLPPGEQEATLNGPALAPPPGIIPILDNPPNGNAWFLVITTFLLAIATGAFVLSIYAKLVFTKKRYLEDYFAFAGYALYVAIVSSNYDLVAPVGVFVHQWNVRVKDLSGILWIVHLVSEIYAVSIMLLKSAILLQWARIFVPRGTRSAFYWTCHIILWTNVFFYTAVLIAGNISCKPYEKLWDKTLPGTCNLNNNAFDVASAAFNVISDILILILPQNVIWRLHLELRKRIGIAVIFAIGLGACTSAIYRLYASISYLEKEDKVYGIGNIALGTHAELVCSILVFYVPTIPKAFKGSKHPFGLGTSLLSRWRRTSTSNNTQEFERKSHKPMQSQSSQHHTDHLGSRMPMINDPVHTTVQHDTSIPHMAILRTTEVSIDEEYGPGAGMATPQYFTGGGYYSHMNSSGALGIPAYNARPTAARWPHDQRA